MSGLCIANKTYFCRSIEYDCVIIFPFVTLTSALGMAEISEPNSTFASSAVRLSYAPPHYLFGASATRKPRINFSTAGHDSQRSTSGRCKAKSGLVRSHVRMKLKGAQESVRGLGAIIYDQIKVKVSIYCGVGNKLDKPGSWRHTKIGVPC
jgi:hypothetical protein